MEYNDNERGKFTITVSVIIAIVLLLLLNSCDVMKNKASSINDTQAKEQIETKTFRKGDTVTYIVPKVTLKDTTIYTYNKQGTTLKTVYDKNGGISSIDCFASAIEELKSENRQFQQSILEQTKDKKSEVNDQWIWAIAVGGVLIICFALFLFMLYLKKVTPKF